MVMTEAEAYENLKKKLISREWRLYNLYYIINKYGKNIKFIPNDEQREILVDNIWYLEVILKARQKGISTGIEIFILDMCLFNSNIAGGIIDATLPDAKKKLDKCRHAYNNLPDWLKEQVTLLKDNEQELRFSNGSYITADTSFRGSTLNVLHISEYAKICKKEPLKASEIKSGALNAVAKGQFVFIESTAEDSDGNFYEIVQKAEKLQKSQIELTQLDYKFFFFPWYTDVNYSLDKPSSFAFSNDSINYFLKLEQLGIILTDAQKFWYVKKKEEQGEDMKKEYPATSAEAFQAASEDKYYKQLMLIAEGENRITEFEVDVTTPVDLDLDLGRADSTPVIFSQIVGKELRIVDELEIADEALPLVVAEIREKLVKLRAPLGKIWLPHDAVNDLLGSEKNIYQQMVGYFGSDKIRITPKLDIEVGILEVRKIFPRLWFKRSTTERMRSHLEKYSKKWNEVLGKYTGAKHDEHSHFADATRYLAVRYKEPEAQKKKIKVIKNKYKPNGGI